MKPRAVSFDVFDTVLTRAVGSPRGLFTLLGHALRARGAIGCAPAELARARQRAELDAYRGAKAQGREVRLDEIAVELAQGLGLPSERAAEIERAEMMLEARLLHAVRPMQGEPGAARATGAAVAYVSDTPLPEAFVRAQLARHGLLDDRDLVLVSSACGANKADGALYRELACRTGAAPHEILHLGNDLRHDVAAAKRAGLRAELRACGNLNRYEALLDGFCEPTAGLAPCLAGAARLARLQVEAHTPRDRALRDVAAGVVAPLLSAYVIWVLREAQRRGLAQLWFLGRDGQVLHELAGVLAPALGVAVEARYLHASRQAWNLAAFCCGAHPDLAWIWDRTDDLSAETLLARLGIEPRDVAAELAACGLHAHAWSRPLATAELDALRAAVARPGIRARAAAAAQAQHALMLRWLAQEGVTAARPAAIVELAGHGNLQESLTAVLRAAGAPAPHGFYLALMPDPRERAMTTPLCWLDDTHRQGLVPGFAVIALEAFCAADHGTLLGFAADGDRVAPRLAPPNQPVLGWGLPLLRRTTGAFARALVLDRDLVDPDADVRQAVLATLRAFWTGPSADEATAWGAFPWEDGHGARTRHLPLARAHGWRDVARALRRGQVPRLHRAAWRQGSVALTPPARRLALRAALRLSALFGLR